MDRKTIRKILGYAKELKWKLAMAMDKISELQPSQTPNNTSKLKKYQWYRVIDGEIREWTDAKYTEAEMDIFPYNLQRWYKAEQTVETIVEGMGSCFEQELEKQLIDGLSHSNKIESIISSFENLFSDLVDQFEFIKIQNDTIENDEVKLAVDEFITKIVKFQMEISDMIVDLKHSKNRCVLQ